MNTITIKYKQFRVGPFMPVFQKLTTYDKFPAKLLYNVTRLAKKLDSAAEAFNEKFVALVNEYAVKDDKGVIIPRKNQKDQVIPNSFDVDPAREEEWKKKIEVLDETSVTIDRAPLSVEEIMGAGLGMTAQELIILDTLLDTSEDEAPALKSVK